MKFCEKTSETLRNALDIFFRRRIARWRVAQRLEPKMLPFYLVFAAVLFPSPAAGQSRAFAVESEVTIRADSFKCKEVSELDRLLQRNQSGGFASGTTTV